jgi:hypothetical protein
MNLAHMDALGEKGLIKRVKALTTMVNTAYPLAGHMNKIIHSHHTFCIVD